MDNQTVIQRIDTCLRIRRNIFQHDVPEYAHSIINQDILTFVHNGKSIERMIRLSKNKVMKYYIDVSSANVKIVNAYTSQNIFLKDL